MVAAVANHRRPPPPTTPRKPDKSKHLIASDIFFIILAVVALTGFLFAHQVLGAVIGTLTLGSARLALVLRRMSSPRKSKPPGRT